MTQLHLFSLIPSHGRLSQEVANPRHQVVDRVNTLDPRDRGQLKIQQQVPVVMTLRNLDTTRTLRGRREAPLQQALQEPQAVLRQLLHVYWPDEVASKLPATIQT